MNRLGVGRRGGQDKRQDSRVSLHFLFPVWSEICTPFKETPLNPGEQVFLAFIGLGYDPVIKARRGCD
jgi:hypothetical protein